jgi:hypothetical protein
MNPLNTRCNNFRYNLLYSELVGSGRPGICQRGATPRTVFILPLGRQANTWTE